MRTLRNDFFRAITGRGFYISIFMLCTIQYIGQRENFALERSGSLITNIQMMLGSGPMSWVFPGIGALCYADSCIKDIETGNYRYQLARMPLIIYVFSKAFVCYIMACLSTVIATLIYIVIASGHFDFLITSEEIKMYNDSLNSFDLLIVQEKYFAYIMVLTLCEGLCAGMWATTGMTISLIWRNRYIAFIAPSVLIYAKDYFYAWCGLPSNNILRTFQLGYIANIPGVGLPLIITIGLFGGFAFVSAICMYFIIRRAKYV